MDLVVVMPVYNEINCIETVVRQWISQIDSLTLRALILLIDDGSTDGTSEVLNRMARESNNIILLKKENGGHGPAVMTGYRQCCEQLKPTWVFQVDSDGQFHPNDIELFLSEKEKSSFLIGKRTDRKDGVLRDLVSLILKIFVFIFFQVRVSDPNIPFRLMKTSELENFIDKIPPDSFAPNIFISALAAKKFEYIGNIPVRHIARNDGIGHLNIVSLSKACLKSVVQLITFRLRNFS